MWLEKLTAEERREVETIRHAAEMFSLQGGHIHKMIIAKMAQMLDELELSSAEKSTRPPKGESFKGYYDVSG